MRTIRFSAAGESSRGTLTAGLAERWSFGRAATSAANCPLRCAARRRHVAARTRTGFLSQKAAFLGEVVGVLVLGPMKLRCCMPNKMTSGVVGVLSPKSSPSKNNVRSEPRQYPPRLGVQLSYRAFTVSANAWRTTVLSSLHSIRRGLACNYFVEMFQVELSPVSSLKNLYKLPESIKNA